MTSNQPSVTARSYGRNVTYIYEYSRGLAGVNVPLDVLITRIIYSSLILLALGIFCGRIAQLSHAYLRQITSTSANKRQQTFWSLEQSALWANVKKHLLHAPIGKKRHNREIQLSSAVNMGTLPSRFQAILITLYFASQVTYCLFLDYDINPKAALVAELRGRSGTLAVFNMVLLFLLAGRNSPLIPLLHISFDTYNLLHRWLGRIIVLEAITHTTAWAINAIDEQNLSHMLQRLRDTPFFSWGLVGTTSMIILVIHSPSPIRHAFYETFLHIHQLAAFLAFLGVFIHLHMAKLPQRRWANLIGAIWFFERTARLVRLLHLNFSSRHGLTRMTVQALPGEACRVTFHLPKRVHIGPGSHVYAYIPSVSWWMSHPFSVAWVQPGSSGISYKQPEKLPPLTPSSLEKQPLPTTQTTTQISLLITARQGMTRTLYNLTNSQPNKILRTIGLIEGPYGTHPAIPSSYGTTILFSAGAGITHHLLTTQLLLQHSTQHLASTRRIILIWSIRSTEHLSWIKPWMNHILRLPRRREILLVKLFVSKPQRAADIMSPSANVQMFSGRCRPGVVIDEILPGRIGAVLVSVCGPGAFADEVRFAVRERVGTGAMVDFVEEAFSW